MNTNPSADYPEAAAPWQPSYCLGSSQGGISYDECLGWYDGPLVFIGRGQDGQGFMMWNGYGDSHNPGSHTDILVGVPMQESDRSELVSAEDDYQMLSLLGRRLLSVAGYAIRFLQSADDFRCISEERLTVNQGMAEFGASTPWVPDSRHRELRRTPPPFMQWFTGASFGFLSQVRIHGWWNGPMNITGQDPQGGLHVAQIADEDENAGQQTWMAIPLSEQEHKDYFDAVDAYAMNAVMLSAVRRLDGAVELLVETRTGVTLSERRLPLHDAEHYIGDTGPSPLAFEHEQAT